MHVGVLSSVTSDKVYEISGSIIIIFYYYYLINPRERVVQGRKEVADPPGFGVSDSSKISTTIQSTKRVRYEAHKKRSFIYHPI